MWHKMHLKIFFADFSFWQTDFSFIENILYFCELLFADCNEILTFEFIIRFFRYFL